jgi:hypothetical protein
MRWGRSGMHVGLWCESQKEIPRHRWEDNIKMDQEEILGCGDMYWINLSEDRD